jgi:hypothetical protein
VLPAARRRLEFPEYSPEPPHGASLVPSRSFAQLCGLAVDRCKLGGLFSAGQEVDGTAAGIEECHPGLEDVFVLSQAVADPDEGCGGEGHARCSSLSGAVKAEKATVQIEHLSEAAGDRVSHGLCAQVFR